ncbi:5'-3' exonuclease H3TH domain-containing protein [Streptomyces sp. BE20]|uniref:5'-3' exonuclease n=1 Tax=Streptomyces sp. BE20 TaxID=3002525 RepID=UPI002E771819|nr:5'-3' exonuclease H3TH domain-containing protein [Streptomyces sp. BE20]MEE1823884.1 5'-3' exonuclease H3TH domain-containing protein [Streptomyces sp. BE20]
MTPSPLLLVDGHHLLYRAWYGFAARIFDRDKQHDRTGVFGFAALLRKAQLQHAAGHEMFVVFDSEDGAQGRVEQDDAYKANRAVEPDPGLMGSLVHIKAALDGSGVRWIEQDGCEGDDVIATLTTLARRQGRPVDVMSGDKDFLQLLADPEVRLLNTMLAEQRRYSTGADVIDRFGVTAAQWPDYRALTGDPADNIAGVRGIGAKTATRLLRDTRSLEQIPADELRPAWAGQWQDALRWREMIRLDHKVELPDELLTGTPTEPLPRAAIVLERLDLW